MKVNFLTYTLEFTVRKQTGASDARKFSSTPSVVPCGLTNDTQATPWTDSEVKQVLQTGQHQKVKAEFARQLERKLNEYQRNNGQHTLADGKASR
jgi:hypothetical protein